MFQCSVNINSNEQFLKSGQRPQLTIYSAGHALQVFVNGQSYGTVCLNLVLLSELHLSATATHTNIASPRLFTDETFLGVVQWQAPRMAATTARS